ncbi:MAG: hypothetical protein ACE5KX_04855 [Acidimicrobiia bacterium]
MKTEKLLVVLVLGAAACATPGSAGSTTTSPQAPGAVAVAPGLVLIAQYVGGCARLDPGCPTYALFSDGSYTVGFDSAPDGGVMRRGTIDPAIVIDLVAEVHATDFSELRATLAPGRCVAPVDGIDITYVWQTDEGQESLSSCDFALDADVRVLRLSAATIGRIEQDLGVGGQ